MKYIKHTQYLFEAGSVGTLHTCVIVLENLRHFTRKVKEILFLTSTTYIVYF